MSRMIEASGKTVKDATAKGLEQLGCTLDQVEVSVIEMGSPGIFGMFGKPAKVRLTVKEEDSAFDIEMPVLSLDQKAEKKKKAQPEKKKPAVVEVEAEPETEEAAEPEVTEVVAEEARQPKADKPKRSRNRREKKEKNSEPRPEPVTVAAPAEPEEPFEPTDEGSLSDTAKAARDFIVELTAKMNVPAAVAVMEKQDALRMELSGENMSILIGRRGETLDAIQYLTSLNVNRGREDYMRVTLDTENYRSKREDTLRKLAVRMANRAKKSGRRVALEPMNPNERRILHSALQNDPEVTTHSEGEEPFRRVIITLK